MYLLNEFIGLMQLETLFVNMTAKHNVVLYIYIYTYIHMINLTHITFVCTLYVYIFNTKDFN